MVYRYYPFLIIEQWGIISVSTANAQGVHYASTTLPLTAEAFLQGISSFNDPKANTILVTAIFCTNNEAIIGVQLLPGYTGNPATVRWLGIFK
jgi:hypothetical protein